MTAHLFMKRQVGAMLAWGMGWMALSLTASALGAAPPDPSHSVSRAPSAAVTRPDSGPNRGGGQQADFDSLIELIQLFQVEIAPIR